MAHHGTLRDREFAEDVDDVRGAKVYGLEDEKIGEVDDVIFDHATGEIRYVVIDSGGWLSSRLFLVPADRLGSDSKHPDDFKVGVTKEQVKDLPPYNEKKLQSEDEWKKYEEEYKRAWHEAPVQHRHGSSRNITPEEEPESGAESSGTSGERVITAADLMPERLAPKFSDPTPSGSKVTLGPTRTTDKDEGPLDTRLTERLLTFQKFLHRNRDEMRSGCSVCEEAAGKSREVA